VPSKGLISNLLTRPVFSGERGENPDCFIDTSTLIYLDRLSLLDLVLTVFTPATIAQVIVEFGRHPRGLLMHEAGEGPTDSLLVRQAAIFHAVVFSEDKKLLRSAGSHGLEYYNTLMIVLALYCRGEISRERCGSLLAKLKPFARYGENVWDYGRQVFAFLVERENVQLFSTMR
jgi:hypothetical protein